MNNYNFLFGDQNRSKTERDIESIRDTFSTDLHKKLEFTDEF